MTLGNSHLKNFLLTVDNYWPLLKSIRSPCTTKKIIYPLAKLHVSVTNQKIMKITRDQPENNEKTRVCFNTSSTCNACFLL